MLADRHIPGYALPRVLLRIVGVVCTGLAVIGLLVAVLTVVNFSFLSSHRIVQAPYTHHFFAVYMFIAVTIHICMLFCGSQFLRCRTNVRWIHLLCCGAMIAVFIASGFLWTLGIREIAMSAASATGIGLGSLMPYIMTLFPFWSPPIVFWAHRKLYREPAARREAGCCPHCGYDRHGSTGPCPECGLAE